MDRHIVVLGTDHALQGAEKVSCKKKIADPTYGVLVEKLIKDLSIEYVFEEASGLGPTTASALKRPGLKYADVDPPGLERHSHGIPEGSHRQSPDRAGIQLQGRNPSGSCKRQSVCVEADLREARHSASDDSRIPSW